MIDITGVNNNGAYQLIIDNVSVSPPPPDGSGTWTNTSGGNWAAATNWAGATVGYGNGQTADFSTLSLSATPVVTVNAGVPIGTILFDDRNATKHGWLLSGGRLILAVGSGTPGITTNVPVSIGSALDGTQGFAKTGDATLTLSSTGSTYMGTATINAGTLIAAANGNVTGGLSSGSAVSLGNTTGASDATLQLGSSNSATYANNLTVQSGNSGVMSLRGHGNINLNGTVTLGTAGATGKSLSLADPGNATWTFTLGGVIQDPTDMTAGTAGAVTIGSNNVGTVKFSAANTYAGNTRIAAGTLNLNHANALHNSTLDMNTVDTGSPTFNQNSTLGGLTGSRNVNMGTHTLSFGNNGTSTVYTGELSNGALTKIGGGSLTLAGTNTYTDWTNVNNGTLILGGSGSIASNVNVATGAHLAGTGSITGNVSLASGATLAPAEVGTIGTLTIDGSLTLAGNTRIDLNKSGTTLTSDRIAGTGTAAIGGTLTINTSGDTLAAGDEFTIFTNVDTNTGSFNGVTTQPSLAEDLSWDLSNLLTSGAGTIKVVNGPNSPLFSPPSGYYAGAQNVILSSIPGATIYYTLDGSPPTKSSPHDTSPVTVIVPTDVTNYTINAFAWKSGNESQLASATYTTVTTPTWNVDNDGNWSQADQWLSGVIPDGAGVPADFNALPQSADTTITLDTNRTVGSMVFGNTNDFNWRLNSSADNFLTLDAGPGTPSIIVLDNTTTISAVLAGAHGLLKSGNGTLALTSANTFTGGTTIDAGTLLLSGAGNANNGDIAITNEANLTFSATASRAFKSPVPQVPSPSTWLAIPVPPAAATAHPSPSATPGLSPARW